MNVIKKRLRHAPTPWFKFLSNRIKYIPRSIAKKHLSLKYLTTRKIDLKFKLLKINKTSHLIITLKIITLTYSIQARGQNEQLHLQTWSSNYRQMQQDEYRVRFVFLLKNFESIIVFLDVGHFQNILISISIRESSILVSGDANRPHL